MEGLEEEGDSSEDECVDIEIVVEDREHRSDLVRLHLSLCRETEVYLSLPLSLRSRAPSPLAL
jgi:hypothetical protein